MSVANLSGKLFAYKIKYNQKEGITNPDTALFPGKNVVAKYNGNIAEVDWRAVETIGQNPSLTPKRYGYAYDPLNRLTAGYYQNPNNPNSKENIESLTYDLNGNISKLYRTSVLQGTIATKIDDLEYTYIGNQAIKIKDNSGNNTGYEGIAGYPITYDLNGNMENMADKSISAITYNHLNLPHELVIDKGTQVTTITTKYSGDGTKLRKENYTSVSGVAGTTWSKGITDYLDGFQYLNLTSSGGSTESLMNLETSRALEMQAFSVEPMNVTTTLESKNPDLQFFSTAEGFYDYTKDQYIYQYKDHLGNVRISFAKGSTGVLEITDSNDYYPFGMNHLKTGNSFFSPSAYKSYKYNSKELQESGMYSFKFRHLLVDIPQWTTPDPLAELYPGQSPYAFVGNNPINRIDPLGLTDYKVNGETRTINDGHTDVIMNVTKRQFNRLQSRFDKGGSGYERLMNRLSDRNGYMTLSRNGNGIGDGFTITKHKPGEDTYGQWSIQNNHQTYGTVEHIARITDSGLGSVTGQFGNINVGSNNKLYFRQNTGRIFNGNQYVRTVSAASKYSKLAKGAKWGGLATGVALGGYEIYQGVQQDGGTYGYNAQVQTGGAVGGLAGGWAGAEAGAAAGAAIGALFGGVGAVPGGIIGGLIGGAAGAWGGDYYGEKAAKAIIE